MYQVNFLPWRDTVIRKKALVWLYQSLSLTAITLIICSYYTYYLVQKRQTLTAQQFQIQQQENRLTQYLAEYSQEKKKTTLRYQHYWLYYQHWYQTLRYIDFFQSIEPYLPPTGWINHFSDIDNHLSLHLILPYQQSLFLLSHIEHHPLLSSLTLSSLQQSQTSPSYTEIYFNGYWKHHELSEESEREKIITKRNDDEK